MRLTGKRTLRLTVLAALVVPLALLAAGCGGGGKKASTGAAGGGKPHKGGTITVLTAGDVDFIDPGQAYSSFTYEITYATQRPLYAYKPDSVDPEPDLAQGQPEVSADGKTVTVKLKHGIKFSPPVNREVTSADVKYAIERGWSTSVSNGYVGAYFGGVVGAPSKALSEVPNVSGIQTPD
jgi:peptide/nickel transport system substrate-binding protein